MLDIKSYLKRINSLSLNTRRIIESSDRLGDISLSNFRTRIVITNIRLSESKKFRRSLKVERYF